MVTSRRRARFAAARAFVLALALVLAGQARAQYVIGEEANTLGGEQGFFAPLAIGPALPSPSVSLLLKGNGAVGSTSIVDSSVHNLTVTANNDVKISDTQSKFGETSIQFNKLSQFPTSSRLVVSTNPVLDLGTGDYTIEAWLYLTANYGSFNYVFNIYSQNGDFLQMRFGDYVYGERLQIWTPPASELGMIALTINVSSQTPYTKASFYNQWRHVAVVRSGGVLSVFIDGVKAGRYTGGAEGGNFTTASHNLNSQTALKVSEGSNLDFFGWIDNFRVTKGIALYTENFTPPGDF